MALLSITSFNYVNNFASPTGPRDQTTKLIYKPMHLVTRFALSAKPCSATMSVEVSGIRGMQHRKLLAASGFNVQLLAPILSSLSLETCLVFRSYFMGNCSKN